MSSHALLALAPVLACDGRLGTGELLSAPCGTEESFASAVGCLRCQQLLVPTTDVDVDVALRITPTRRPFEVEQVGYFVEGDSPGCDAGRAHRLRLHRTSGLPPNQPTEGLVFESLRPERDYRFVRPVVVDVEPPVRLEAEQSLFLVLNLAEEGSPGGLCLRACETGLPDTDYVSTLSEFGAWLDAVDDSNLRINVQAFARGRTP